MHLYDTMDRELKELTPSDGKTFRFYCCGPTVYAASHIGNFRTFTLQDVLRRTLELTGVETRHVRNITDVDDKTIYNSQKVRKPLAEYTQYWRDHFHKDCERLNLLPPHVEPSAVEHIPHQIELIEQLLEAGHAYKTEEGSVYYKVDSFPSYGKLSRLDERDITTTSVEVIDSDEYEKEALADFALWKAQKPEDGENYWHSPWGEGRPGWHLECSAMSMHYLGETFDLHSGGSDLIFPHHENEIAQSEACTGHPFAHHWFHVARLTIKGSKMSKSMYNFYTITQLIEMGYDPMEVRYSLLSGHYRQPHSFTLDALEAHRQALQKLGRFHTRLKEKTSLHTEPTYAALRGKKLLHFGEAFAALLNDLNTPEALGQLFRTINQIDVDTLDTNTTNALYEELHFMLYALGLKLLPEKPQGEAPESIRELAQKRWFAKKEQNWEQADTLRDEILSQGWIVEDSSEGYTLCPKN